MHETHTPVAAPQNATHEHRAFGEHGSGTPAGHGGHHGHVNYLSIFIALCVCTAISVVFDVLPLNRRMVAVLVLAVAVAKAQYVMRYFMHLKFEGKWKYVLLLPTAILACGIPLALAPDIGLHYYAPVVPQVRAISTARGPHAPETSQTIHPEGEAAAGQEAHAEEALH